MIVLVFRTDRVNHCTIGLVFRTVRANHCTIVLVFRTDRANHCTMVLVFRTDRVNHCRIMFVFRTDSPLVSGVCSNEIHTNNLVYVCVYGCSAVHLESIYRTLNVRYKYLKGTNVNVR